MTKQVITKTTTVVEETQTAILDKSLEEAIALFNDAKDAIKVLEQQKKDAEAVIREAMGDATIGLIDGVQRIKISSVTRTEINRTDLQEAYPEAWALCTKENTYTVVKAVS